MISSQHAYEVRPRKDHRGVDLISDALPFGRLWYDKPNVVTHAIECARFLAVQMLLNQRLPPFAVVESDFAAFADK
jgi:hypothetical protein